MTADFPDWGPAIRAGRFILSGQGHAAVAVTNTAVPLKASTTVQQVMVKADAGNGGTIYVGSSTVTADTTAATGGFQIAAGDMATFPVDNLANVFINGTAGDGVSFMYWT